MIGLRDVCTAGIGFGFSVGLHSGVSWLYVIGNAI